MFQTQLKLMYITNNPAVACIAQDNGVDRIWIDLEKLGKNERQRGMNTVVSNHTLADIRNIKPILKTSELLVRVNPWNRDSADEIDEVINAGADILMLPMWKTPEEVKQFVTAVDGRCRTILLLETKEAMDCLDEVLEIPGTDEFFIGLNDLHISLGMHFMFEPLANGIVDELIGKIRKKNIPYGFGGIAALGSGEIPAERLIMEEYRLGCTGTVLSRSFCNTDRVKDINEIEKIFSVNLPKIRNFEREIAESVDRESNRLETWRLIHEAADRRRKCDR